MDKNARIIAITRILPGLQTFLGEVLANESLSAEAERQRLDFIKELEELTKPPGLPPRPANLKSRSRASVDCVDCNEDDNDFASVQRKLSNIFYLRRDFEELNEHLVNGTIEEGNHKNTSRKTPVKSGKKKHSREGIYEDLQKKLEIEDYESGVLSEEEGSRVNRSISLARGTNFRASLSRGKWFARKEKLITNDIYVSDLQLPTISGHLMEVRTNKRRWCVLKDQHLYIFKNQEEPAHFVIALPGCDISTAPKGDKSKVSYSFKIIQDGVPHVILGIEEEKDLSAWMNALITASVAKTQLSPQHKISKSLPRAGGSPWEKEDADGQSESRRHTFGSAPGYRSREVSVDIELGTYEQPTDALGLAFSLDTENYNPPLPPLPGELNMELEMNSRNRHVRPRSKYSGIYEEVTEDFLNNISENLKKTEDISAVRDNQEVNSSDVNENNTALKNSEENLTSSRRNYSEVATSESEYSSDEEQCVNERLFHDRWAVHSGVLYQKRQGGWNRRYCKIVHNSFKGFRNPDDLTPVVELNLSACNVREAEAEGKRKFIFQLNIAENESLYFNTDTKESLERWLEVISVAATSRPETSITLSEEELDKLEEASDDHHDSLDSIPSPVPERVESLKRSRVLPDADGKGDVTSDSEKNEKRPEDMLHTLPRMNQKRWSSDSMLKKPTESATPPKGSEENMKPNVPGRKDEENEDVWKRRVDQRYYHTAPRQKCGGKNSKPLSAEDAFKSDSSQSLDMSSKSLTSPQHALHISKKHQYAERLKKYLDKNGQFSGFILELRIQPNSTNLTRRWAVVQNGFMRIYENYGCAAPFLRISLVEAFLKDFSNVQKSRFCFMLEYGAGQSILFQTNTHEELKRWVAVITLSIACHADLFGSGIDLRGTSGIARNSCEHLTSNGLTKASDSTLSRTSDGSEVTSPGGNTSDVFGSTSSRITNGVGGHDDCGCDCDDKVNVSCTPDVVKEVIHRKSYSMNSSSSLDSDEVICRNSRESFTYRSSLMEMVKYRGYLLVSCGTDPPQPQFCELKGSLFSVYENEKSEKPKRVFNLLYDKYQEVQNESLSFTLRSDGEGTVELKCESKEDLEAWKRVMSTVALQETSSSDPSPKSDSSVSRKRSSLRASIVEEEAKHYEVLRSLDEQLKKGEVKCDGGDYSCYVYEVRNSSGNKTIIRRWCVINNDVIQIFERDTSREAVTELRPDSYRLKDIENPRDSPFAFKLEPSEATEKAEEVLVFQASNVKDFRELLKRIKIVQQNVSMRHLNTSKSESSIQVDKKNLRGTQPLNHSKSELSLRKEVKRIFSLARKSSKGDITADATTLGHDTWPKVVRRERRTSRRALSDTSTERAVTHSLIETTPNKLENRKSVGCFYDSEGKFTGYLSEVRNSELCRSEVRKWCVVENQQFSAYDDKNTQSPSTVIDLRNVQLVDMSGIYQNSFEFRVNNGVLQSHVYRAASDFQKWIMVLSVASDIGRTNEVPSIQDVTPAKLGSSTKQKDSKKDNKPTRGSSKATAGEDTAL